MVPVSKQQNLGETLLNFVIIFNKVTKTEKVPILGIFSPKTILMFRVGLKN